VSSAAGKGRGSSMIAGRAVREPPTDKAERGPPRRQPEERSRRSATRSRHHAHDSCRTWPDLPALATALFKDPRVDYLLISFQRRIANPEKDGGACAPYTGAGPHENHLHLIYADRRDDRRPRASACPSRRGRHRRQITARSRHTPLGPVPAISMATSLTVEGYFWPLLARGLRGARGDGGAWRFAPALRRSEAQAIAARSYVVWDDERLRWPGRWPSPSLTSTRFRFVARGDRARPSRRLRRPAGAWCSTKAVCAHDTWPARCGRRAQPIRQERPRRDQDRSTASPTT
jgi:hypothetical protein